MADLSNISTYTRKVLEILVASVIAVLGLFLIFRLGGAIKEILIPTPAPLPTVSFGKLTPITFPLNENINYSYTINTLSGKLPVLADRITVYKLQQPSPSLLSLNKAKQVAVAAKFLDQPTQISSTNYVWAKSDPFPMTLFIDTNTLDFSLKSSYSQNKTVLNAVHMPDESVAQTISKTFFDEVMPLPDNIDTDKTKTTLFAIAHNGLLSATSLSKSQIIRVDYFMKAIDKIPIFYLTPDKSLIYTLVASGETDFPQVVEAQYFHKTITNEKATYPIKSAQKALDDLKQGKGYIAVNPTGDTNINITNVTLGYYIDSSAQKYVWPIIVFQGDKGFYAYVSSVSDEWIQK